MNTTPPRKGYDSLSDEQLIELACILTSVKSAGETTITRPRKQITTVTLRGYECRFYEDGEVDVNNSNDPMSQYGMFAFVDKCREFGLTY